MKGTIRVFDNTGGRVASHFLFLRKSRVPMAPNNVAMGPNIMSQKIHPVKTLLSKHPTKSPGTAAGVNIGKIASASENRT